MKHDIAVIGMGYVGSTLAGALNLAGYKVLGVEPRDEVRAKIDAGIAPFREPGLAEALKGVQTARSLQEEDEAETYVVCVGTPLVPDGALERAVSQVADHMRDGALVIIRSTVRVGTTRKVVKPILDVSGKAFDLAYCPERTVEGNALAELRELPQIIGADNDDIIVRVKIALEGAIRRGWEIYPEAAETAKLLANAWRDVTFAFANEVARICDQNGVSAQEAIGAANADYARCAIPMPGPVGGPCLVKDSLLLVPEQRHHSVITWARKLNAGAPAEMASRIVREIWNRGIVGSTVAVLGIAFKGDPETDDVRDSPGAHLVACLSSMSTTTTVDPIAPADLDFAAFAEQQFDVLVIATNHKAWNEIDLRARLKPGGFIYSCWQGYDADVVWGG